MRPIAVGYTIRRLAAKYANMHVLEERNELLQARQVGVGVTGEAEAAIHTTRRFLDKLPPGHAIIKLEIANACNTLRRDLLLDTAARNIHQLNRFTFATYGCEPKGLVLQNGKRPDGATLIRVSRAHE